jgi:hypothetical protein
VGFVEGDLATFVLGTSDNVKARDALSGSVRVAEETQVLVVTVPDEVGSLNAIAQKIASADISIQWAVATTTGGTAAIVFSTSDNARAAELF